MMEPMSPQQRVAMALQMQRGLVPRNTGTGIGGGLQQIAGMGNGLLAALHAGRGMPPAGPIPSAGPRPPDPVMGTGYQRPKDPVMGTGY